MVDLQWLEVGVGISAYPIHGPTPNYYGQFPSQRNHPKLGPHEPLLGKYGSFPDIHP